MHVHREPARGYRILAQIKNARRTMALGAAIVALVAVPATAQAAPNTECRDTIGPVLIEGTIVVPDGETCTLEGTIVDGLIDVGVGSTLIAQGIEVIKAGTVNIQAYGAARIEVTGLLPPGETEVPEELRTRLLGGIQAVAGGTVIVSDTELGGGLQALNNSGPVEITHLFSEGAVEFGKNTGGVSVTGSFLGEGVEISETEGDVTFTDNTSDESDLTIAKTKGDVTVENNPSLGENFEVSETTGHVTVVDNIINDNAEISRNQGGAFVSGNTVGDNLALETSGGTITVPCDPLDLDCLPFEVLDGAVIVVANTVGDNVVILETGGDVLFSENLVEGSAFIDKTKGEVTAEDNSIGYTPPEEPAIEPGVLLVVVPEVASAGSLMLSEASEGAFVRDNTVTGDLEATESSMGTVVSNNMVGVGITVAKNKGGTEVSGNRAGGSIECKDNDPPATGLGNIAGADGGSGTLMGECA